ncbi:hypothetical protein Goklo_008448, partial [Gossypium klotzschianum]|nr:hypothetical protein [Gossypium klotzschianum]
STSAAGNTGSYSEDPNKKIRKPDTITKSKESWTEQEHDKFDHDLKKIEAFDGSKTVVQTLVGAIDRSTAMLRIISLRFTIVVSQVAGPFQSPSALLNSAMPDFAEVYSFIDSVFDPSASGHLQKLKQLDPINFETALLLMRNLCVNLTSPEFEDHVSYCSS